VQEVIMRSMWVRRTPSSVAAVRHAIVVDLQRAGFGRELSDDAALLASELMGNSIRHARSLPSHQVQVDWSLDATGVRIAVTDGGGRDKPVPRQAQLDDTSGRGLTIVAALADDWGVDERPDRTTVWAHLAAPVPSPH
jgi:anti-sigma regulatory factor (Ser/Thr protein kinase)